MSAIGGIIDFKRDYVDFLELNKMRKALGMRGRKKSSAYVDRGIGMFYSSDGIIESEQPYLSERRGYTSVMVMDCYAYGAEAVFEKYRTIGVEMLGGLRAPFAIALYDAERRMLLLARDKVGEKPIFYKAIGGRVYFASEIKGLLALEKEKNGVKINCEKLSQHLTSPQGVYSVSEIYCGFSELRAGECILFTEIGVSKFFFDDIRDERKMLPRQLFKRKLIISDVIKKIDSLELENALSDSLIAFDLPQFDAYMPRLCAILHNSAEGNNLILKYADNMKIQAPRYAYLREDRLSSFYGVIGRGVVVKKSECELAEEEAEHKYLYGLLKERFFELDFENLNIIKNIFGEPKSSYVLRMIEKEGEKKEDTALKIRILGMLCQTVEWSRLFGVELSGDKKYIHYTG